MWAESGLHRREARSLTFVGVVPAKYVGVSVVVDIGSGNTKGKCVKAGTW